MTDSHQHHRPLSGADDWNERYGEDRIWSGRPNGSLLAEVAGMAPGRALDLGCGEGADAIWLASQGWEVTAIDISSVAIARAGQAAGEAGVVVNWVCADFVADRPPAGVFDLVTSHYPALLKSDLEESIEALLSGVAPGGTLLFVAHANTDPEVARSHGFEPDDYIQPADVASRLGPDWWIQVQETRTRASARSEQSPHSEDVVLRARRPA